MTSPSNHNLLQHTLIFLGCITLILIPGFLTTPAHAQSNEDQSEETEQPAEEVIPPEADAGPSQRGLTEKPVFFEGVIHNLPEGEAINEILWDFGDGTRTTGEKVTHAYDNAGTYQVRVTIATDQGRYSDTTEVEIFERAVIILADATASNEQLELKNQQAANEGTLLFVIKAKSDGPEAVIEEELTQALVAARAEVSRAHIISTWTTGAIGPNVLSRFTQTIRQTDDLSFTSLDIESKGIVILTDAAFGVLSPTAQSTFDQLQPSYVVLTRPDALPLLFSAPTAEDARTSITTSPIPYRLLGSFSSRAISDIGLTNFMSFGINYLINGGVPIGNIVLILMIPVIATILSFARQVIGLKAFGLITPAMTTLSFLVMGLQAGLIVFVVVLLSGTLTRALLKRLHLLYLPRMALVLTSASLAILIMFGIGTATRTTSALSFSIFPILILTILAEEFIAVQFSRGVQTALRVTAWTLLLAIICYFIVSWQLLRVTLLSYPELVLLAIPINVLLGRFTGLRLVEYIRFRELLRHAPR